MYFSRAVKLLMFTDRYSEAHDLLYLLKPDTPFRYYLNGLITGVSYMSDDIDVSLKAKDKLDGFLKDFAPENVFEE